MSRTSKSVFLCVVSLAIVASVTSAVVIITRASSVSSPATAIGTPHVNKGRRNLALQPEASRVARLLGKRFGPLSRWVTVFSGQLSVGEAQQPIVLTRWQKEKAVSLSN